MKSQGRHLSGSTRFAGGFLVSFLTSLFFSCAGPHYLKTREASPDEIKGTYDVILYGHRYADDFRNIAFLIREGGKYRFEVYAPEFNYRTEKGMPAEKALQEADTWIRFHFAYLGQRLNKILDFDGSLIGFELRPLYSSLAFSYPDVLEVHYIIEEGKVIASVGLKPEVEQRPFEAPIFRPRVK